MPRSVTAAQRANLELAATRPLYLVSWEHSGSEELLSCGPEIVFDGQTFTAGGLRVDQISDSRSATISLPATSTRVTETQNGTWRQGSCKIWQIPSAPSDGDTFDAADGILLIDGEIRASEFSGEEIVASITHKTLSRKLTPRHTVDAVTAFSPAPGTIISWEGEKLILESPR
jgi:hypothetical protein